MNDAKAGARRIVLDRAVEGTLEGDTLTLRLGELEVTLPEYAADFVRVFETPQVLDQILTEFSRDDDGAREIRGVIEQLAELGFLVETRQDATPADRELESRSIAALQAPGCADLFWVYTGFRAKLQMPVTEFLRRTGLADRNLVMLRDRLGAYYTQGVRADLPSLAALIAWQRGYEAALEHVENVYCIGTSMGAFAALIAGHRLGVRTVWAFAPPIGRFEHPTTGATWNLREILAEHNGKTEYRIYFSEGRDEDRAVAEALADCPGVVLLPQPGDRHEVVESLLDSGLAQGLFPPLAPVRRGSGAPRATSPVAPDTVTDERVLEIVRASVRGELAGRLQLDTRLEGILDSFAVVGILGIVEREMGLRLAPEDLQPARTPSARAIAAVLRRRLATAAPAASPRASIETSTAPGFLGRVLAIATAEPDRNWGEHVRHDGQTRTLDYGELLWSARAHGEGLARLGVAPSDVALLVLDDDREIAQSFLGAMLQGFIPTVLAPPSPKVSAERYRETVTALAKRTGASVCVTSERLASELAPIWATLDLRCGVHAGVALSSGTPTGSIERALHVPPDQPAFLQHSSGTTGLQKGVVVTHEILERHLKLLGPALGYSREDRIVSWLPLYHDMGLVACLLLPMYEAGRVVQLPTFDWLASPGLLLDFISRRRGTMCWLPNFALQFLAGKAEPQVEWDLSSLRLVINCSEPILAQSVDRFAERFAAHGLREEALSASYAMAENVFAFSQSQPGRRATELRVDETELKRGRIVRSAQGRRRLVSSGAPVAQNHGKVVAEDGRELGEGFIGEIWLSSPHLMSGYFRNEEATAKVLRDGWYRTGDLGGFVDGEIYVTGRRSDLIIVGGHNIHAQDIEDAAGSSGRIHPGRAAAVARSDQESGTEEIVLLVERPKDEAIAAPDEEIALAVRQSVARETGEIVGQVVVLPYGWLRKSTSGKISRSLCKARAIEEGRLDPSR